MSTPRIARGVCYANVANLAAFGATTNGITFVENDIVFLPNQTTGTENGPWKLGAVAAGVGPLTRPPNWAAASAIKNGITWQIGGEGTYYAGSTWKAMCTGACVVDTNDPLFMPKSFLVPQSPWAGAGFQGIVGLGYAAPEPLYLRAGGTRACRPKAGPGYAPPYQGNLMACLASVVGTIATAGVYWAVVVAGTGGGDPGSAWTADVLVTNW